MARGSRGAAAPKSEVAPREVPTDAQRLRNLEDAVRHLGSVTHTAHEVDAMLDNAKDEDAEDEGAGEPE